MPVRQEVCVVGQSLGWGFVNVIGTFVSGGCQNPVNLLVELV